MLKVDLHCHSCVSDGLLAPAQVVRRAAQQRVELLALTDHDDVSGLDEARSQAKACGIRFVDGVEVSVTWGETTVHVVGLGIDPQDAQLGAGLASLREGRVVRARGMAQALERIGIGGALAGAMRHAQNASIIGRTHFARFLVERGCGKDVREVFEHYLVRGKPGHVPHCWATLEQAVGWILGAGGVAVLAHPGRYRLSRAQLRALLGEFRGLGGAAIEVASGAHSPQQLLEFARLAREFGLHASCASDFHGPGESYVELGGTDALPDDLTPVWRSLV